MIGLMTSVQSVSNVTEQFGIVTVLVIESLVIVSGVDISNDWYYSLIYQKGHLDATPRGSGR